MYVFKSEQKNKKNNFKVIHRDLKPSNIAIDARGKLTLLGIVT